MEIPKRILLTLLLALVFSVGVFGVWYTIHRNEKITEIKKCLDRQQQPQKDSVPNGKYAPVVMGIGCPTTLIPPSFFDILQGHTVPEGIPNGFRVSEYSFQNILLGNYEIVPGGEASFTSTATSTQAIR